MCPLHWYIHCHGLQLLWKGSAKLGTSVSISLHRGALGFNALGIGSCLSGTAEEVAASSLIKFILWFAYTLCVILHWIIDLFCCAFVSHCSCALGSHCFGHWQLPQQRCWGSCCHSPVHKHCMIDSFCCALISHCPCALGSHCSEHWQLPQQRCWWGCCHFPDQIKLIINPLPGFGVYTIHEVALGGRFVLLCSWVSLLWALAVASATLLRRLLPLSRLIGLSIHILWFWVYIMHEVVLDNWFVVLMTCMAHPGRTVTWAKYISLCVEIYQCNCVPVTFLLVSLCLADLLIGSCFGGIAADAVSGSQIS